MAGRTLGALEGGGGGNSSAGHPPLPPPPFSLTNSTDHVLQPYLPLQVKLRLLIILQEFLSVAQHLKSSRPDLREALANAFSAYLIDIRSFISNQLQFDPKSERLHETATCPMVCGCAWRRRDVLCLAASMFVAVLHIRASVCPCRSASACRANSFCGKDSFSQDEA